jgi:proteasome alpha subunit
LLLVDKNIVDPLIVADTVEKIYQVDKHIGIATTGLVADGRRLVEKARLDAQSYRLTYGKPISPEELIRKICDHMQLYTQIGGLRPFGVAVLLGGLNDQGEIKLYESDPSGSFWQFKATAIGENSTDIKRILSEEYDPNLEEDAAINLVLKTLYRVSEEQFNAESIEISLIRKKTGRYYRLTDKEVETHLNKLLKK